VIFSCENVPAAEDEGLRHEAESYIASLSGLRVNRSKPGTEFWFLQRREGAFFMQRLSHHGAWDKTLHPGELPPPLAWMLCWLAKPRYGEKSADPFCGYGSIAVARLRHFPPGEFFASDTDAKALAYGKGKFKGEAASALSPKCHFNRIDARELARIIPPGSLDSIITDPPWGFYRKNSPAPTAAGELYARCFKVFAGLLKPGGRMVILCGRGEKPGGGPSAADELLQAADQNSFTLTRSIPILVSGKKAVIFLLEQKTI
jgi:SAM-dependent methyltransferase